MYGYQDLANGLRGVLRVADRMLESDLVDAADPALPQAMAQLWPRWPDVDTES